MITPQKKKHTELKFKMESVGNKPEDDDDLHLCPARTRPLWPKKIIPWWTPSYENEKPPYSYSTLISHAILSSKDGRLTLSDIYQWISETYPYFKSGKNGWQNSIRHNLSLNKKWFCKVDRRPTQANPGKGCYWTLIAGTEPIFIENLTEESCHNRKQNDVGLTAELSIGKRRGACYYHVTPENSPPLKTSQLSSHNPAMNSVTAASLSNQPTMHSFKMINVSPNYDRRDDSDSDSGLDININTDYKSRKRLRTTKNMSISISTASPTPSISLPLSRTASLASASTPISSASTPILQHHVSPNLGYVPTSLAQDTNLSSSPNINQWLMDQSNHSNIIGYSIPFHDLYSPTTPHSNHFPDYESIMSEQKCKPTLISLNNNSYHSMLSYQPQSELYPIQSFSGPFDYPFQFNHEQNDLYM